MSHPAAIVTNKTGNRRNQQVTEASIMQRGIAEQKKPAGDNTGVIREDVPSSGQQLPQQPPQQKQQQSSGKIRIRTPMECQVSQCRLNM
jgi:hypothetical protein